MRRFIAVLPLLFATAILAEGPEFEVASIKATPPNPSGMIFIGPPRGGPGSADPTHINWPSAVLKNVVMNAFDVKNFQVVGPDELDQLRFDFAVGIPEGSTKEQVAMMWRNLLTSRFKMKYHVEQREFNVGELTVGPRGHKLVENTDAPAPPATLPLNAPPPGGGMPGPPPMDKDGRPVMNGPGLMMLMSAGPTGTTAKSTAKAQPLSAIIQMLSNQIGYPVVDKTGLTGKYDFFLEFAPRVGPGGAPLIGARGPAGPGTVGGPMAQDAAADLGLDLETAVQQQLGLKLSKGKGNLDVIVVEKIERVPTEN